VVPVLKSRDDSKEDQKMDSAPRRSDSEHEGKRPWGHMRGEKSLKKSEERTDTHVCLVSSEINKSCF